MPQKLVSVGMAVRNEERWLSQALDSVLAQDYQNIEVIICDNLSTDKTADIAKEYAKRDSRIKYFLNKEKVSSFKNYSLSFERSSGEYFMFCGGHDLLDKKYVSSCVKILDNEPNVVLAYSLYEYINFNNNTIISISYACDTRRMNVFSRVRHFFLRLLESNPFSGLIRSSIIKKIAFVENFKNVLNDDVIFFFQLSLMGEFVQIPNTLFYYRINRPNDKLVDSTLKHIKDIYGKKKYPLFFYVFHQFYVYYLDIYRFPINLYYKPIIFLLVITDVCLLYLRMIIKILIKNE